MAKILHNQYQLPERLKKKVQGQQARSEILISLIQIIIVSILGLLYAVSPKTFSENVTFAPVPWVLGAYLAFSFTTVRLNLNKHP